MRPSLAATALLLASVLPAPALDITGIVLDKVQQPIPSAKVCVKNNPTRCVTTGVNGIFRVTDAVHVGAGSGGGDIPYAMELVGSRMAFTTPRGAGAPESQKARVSWHDASGRALARELAVDLRPGRNLLPLPELPRDGIHFVRIALPGLALSWKVLLLDGPAPGRGSAPQGRPLAALSKAAAAVSDLEVTKSGFRTASYRPSREVETAAIITLTAVSDSGIVYTSSFTSKNTLDRDKSQWITEDTVHKCKGSVPVDVVVRDTSSYAVRDGKLFQYYPGECLGQVLSGGNSDVLGTWNLFESDVFLPADLRPAACKDTVPSSPVPESVKGKVTITETEQDFEISAEVCPPDLYLDLIADSLLTDSTVRLTGNTCRRLSFKNGAGEEARLDFSKQGDSLISEFTFGGLTCRASETTLQDDDMPIDCASVDPVIAFLDCMGSTAYFGDPSPSPMPKPSAGISRASLPGPALPGPRSRPGAPTPSRWPASTLSRLPAKVYISHP